MKLSQIREFIAVAERGSLRAAAKHLGVAQPAISRSIRDLEHELGAALFERSALGVVLTQIGKHFLQRVTVAQHELQRAKDEVQQLNGVSTGTVSMGLSSAPHISLLPTVIQDFQRKFPDVRLNIFEGLFPSMEAALHDGSIDFYVGPASEDRLSGAFRVEKLFDNLRAVLGRRGHPLRGARSLRDLAGARWVATSVTVNSGAELNPVFERAGLPRPVISVQTHSTLSLIMVASSSDLLALVPQQWVAFAKQTALLMHIPIQERLEAPAINIITRARLPLTPVAEQLCDLFRRASLNQHG